jgi:hypothetical protein
MKDLGKQTVTAEDGERFDTELHLADLKEEAFLIGTRTERCEYREME